MKNEDVAKVLNRLADFMEMDDLFFQTRAYRTAADNIEALADDIEKIAKDKELQNIPGVGENIANKIDEYLETGNLEVLDELKEKYPIEFDELLPIEGLGLKTIKKIFLELGVYNLDSLERAAKNNELRKLKGLGPKSEENIIKNIQYARKFTDRMFLSTAFYLSEDIKKELLKLDSINRIETAGSIRRARETCGDIDLLVTISNDVDFEEESYKIMDYFVNLNFVEDLISKGSLKTTVRLKDGIDCDLRVFTEDQFGAALMHFTGSKNFNVKLRTIAISKNMKLNEYGIFKTDNEELVASKTENDMFNALGLDYIPPELREDYGEVEASIDKTLPNLIKLSDIKGDLHSHTKWSDGFYSIRDMALNAEKLGYEFYCVTDHVYLPVANGLKEDKVLKQMDEIDDLNNELDIKILKGVETNIRMNGDVDLSEDILEELDVVVASIHNGLNKDMEVMTNRLIAASENDLVNIIGHPSGRRISEKEAYPLNYDKLFESCRETKTYLEINSSKLRLDLNGVYTKKAIENGCKLAINTDAHRIESLNNMKFGVLTARRGWAEKEDILNTLPLKEMLKSL